MPVLKKIVVQNFRNIELQELEFAPNINCITGNNGEGKTNLLDAIYYLSMTKSAFSPTDRFAYRHGSDTFALSGLYDMNSGTESRFSIKVSDTEGKRLVRDDKPVRKISSHIGILPIVMVSPADVSMVSESGDERRRFVNSVISQMDPTYLAAVQQYNRILTLRNKLLKEDNPNLDMLCAYDTALEQYAGPVFSARGAFVSQLNPLVSEYYSKISSCRETIAIEYKSDLQKAPLSEVLSSHRSKDIALGFTGAGLQRDDFHFMIDGFPIRKCGSQGQQKSFLVALKFAQYDIMKNRCGIPPILLLDDLFDKLDMSRVSNLLNMVAGNDFGQIFISDSNKVRISSIVEGLEAESAYFEATAGTFKKMEV